MINNKEQKELLLKQLTESAAFGKKKGDVKIYTPEASDIIKLFDNIEAIKVANPTIAQSNEEDIEIYPKYILESRINTSIADMGDMYATVGILVNRDKIKNKSIQHRVKTTVDLEKVFV